MIATTMERENALQNGSKQEKPGEAMIKTTNLWKTYVMGEEEIHALRGVTFEIKRNEYVAI
ncbi:MAG: macrolide ABC transporter ATP-binding protein, partial [Blastocatellia bacterium]